MHPHKLFTVCSTFLFVATSIVYSFAQTEKVNASFEYHIKRASAPIRIDGVDDDEAWLVCQVAKDFYMVLPMDTSMAKVPTEVRMTYDEKNIYLQAVCYHSLDTKYTVESLKRDFAFGKNDNFLLFIDTFDDQTNGFSFGSSAAGAQWDGIMYEGSKVDLSWDNKWTSAVTNFPDRWVFEASIPFKSIRYKKGIMKWGINFSRLDLKTTEKSSWTPITRQFATASLSHTGFLVWDETPPAPRMNVSVIPYLLGSSSKNHERQTPVDNNLEAGMDAKIALTSSLNLDLTVNPDFSQVDVDRQVTNLDRFELFFPERRQFFLENGDIFSNFGYATIRPFFSRRIGLGVPIDAGARLSGRINRNWRLGAMDMQTAAVDDTGLPAQNFAVASLQRRLFARSNVGAFFVNKQSLNYDVSTIDPKNPVYSQYNRNAGLEYNLASRDNKWTGKALVLRSMSPGQTAGTDNWVYAGHLQYFGRHWLTAMQVERVGPDYSAEVGYVPRVNFARFGPQASYLFFPKGKYVLSHGPKVISSIFMNTNYERTDNETTAAYTLNFRNLSILTVGMIKNYVQLLRPFDPTNSGLETLEEGSRHSWTTFGLDYTSRPQKLLTLNTAVRYGGYYADGTRLSVVGEVGYRFQPYVNFLLSTSYNDIRLPEPWGRRPFWLISPRLDVTMTNKLFFTTFLQYNEQTNNVNINSRIQWRFKPASDIFIVYTDNYLPENWAVKSRAIVLKFTYWWNL
jgi:Domain of unknown function (DUF5916)/Carbohydrate family 9 binding domain-like